MVSQSERVVSCLFRKFMFFLPAWWFRRWHARDGRKNDVWPKTKSCEYKSVMVKLVILSFTKLKQIIWFSTAVSASSPVARKHAQSSGDNLEQGRGERWKGEEKRSFLLPIIPCSRASRSFQAPSRSPGFLALCALMKSLWRRRLLSKVRSVFLPKRGVGEWGGGGGGGMGWLIFPNSS